METNSQATLPPGFELNSPTSQVRTDTDTGNNPTTTQPPKNDKWWEAAPLAQTSSNSDYNAAISHKQPNPFDKFDLVPVPTPWYQTSTFVTCAGVAVVLSFFIVLYVITKTADRLYKVRKNLYKKRTRICIFASVSWLLVWPVMYAFLVDESKHDGGIFLFWWLLIPMIVLIINGLYSKIVDE